MAAHRYWRLAVSDNTGQPGWHSFMAAEIQFRDTEGGSHVSGTVSADNEVAGFEASKAVDGNTATAYATNGAVAFPHYYNIDFGSGNDKDIVQVVYMVRQDTGPYPDYAPSAFNIQYSDNNSSWTTARAVTGIRQSDWNPGTVLQPFTIDGSVGNGELANRWRFNCTLEQNITGGGALTGGVTINELGFFDSGGTEFSKTAIRSMANANYSGAEPYKAANSGAGNWGVVHSSMPGILEFEFPTKITPSTVKVKGSSDPSISPKDFKIQYWNGSTWVDYITVSGEPTWSANEERTYAPAAAPRRRLSVVT